MKMELHLTLANANIVVVLAVIFVCFTACTSQEVTYFVNLTEAQEPVDLDPETSVEDVAIPERHDPIVEEITAVAKIYQISNVTSLEEKSQKSSKVVCLNNTNDAEVELFNSTGLMNSLFVNPDIKKKSTPSNCTILMFYAHWCPFSSKAAPHFNALPRVFPALKVGAIDAAIHSSVNTYFGILSVPTVMLFHNGKLVAKYNDSIFNLAKLAEFITSNTDIEGQEKLNVTSQDFQGPLPSSETKDRDMYLYLSWIFITICFINYVRQSRLFKSFVEFVRVTWREAEDQHEHAQ